MTGHGPHHLSRTRWASASFVLGLGSVLGGLCLTGIPAIFCGRRAERAGHSRLAGAGLVLGYTGTFLTLVVIAAWLVTPALRHSWQGQEATRLELQLRRVGQAVLAYENDRGAMPTRLEDVVPDYLPDRAALLDPVKPDSNEVGFLYYGSGVRRAELTGRVLLATRWEHHGQRLFLLPSGRTLSVPAAELRDGMPVLPGHAPKP